MGLSNWLLRLPWSVLALAIALVGLGWLGIARDDELRSGSATYAARHVWFAALALVTMLAASWPNYRPLARWSFLLFGIVLALLVAVYWFEPINGARRWIRLGPIGFQPSELAKLAFVLALARYLMYRDSYRRLTGLLAPLALVLVPLVLVLREPNLGTALVFLPVLLAMLFAAGARGAHLTVAVMCGLAAVPLVWSQMNREQRSRVTALANQPSPPDAPSDDAYHLFQSRQMLALGGWTGSLFSGGGESNPSSGSVPEGHTDSIVSVIGERLGLVGLGVVLLLQWALAARILAIAQATREPFGRLAAIGIAALLGVQTVLNAGMMVGLAPITGLALPLVSYGGTGLVVWGLALGLVMNIAMRPGYEVGGEPFAFAR